MNTLASGSHVAHGLDDTEEEEDGDSQEDTLANASQDLGDLEGSVDLALRFIAVLCASKVGASRNDESAGPTSA